MSVFDTNSHCSNIVIIMCVILPFTVLLTIIPTLIKSYQLMVGPCPVHVNEPCNTDTIKFFLHKNNSYADTLDPFKPQLPHYYNASIPTKLIIHGYTGRMDYATKVLTAAYLQNSNVNVIVVDWNSLSQLPCYPTAVLNTWQAGQCTAILIVSLAALGLDPRELHLLGFSLGAHVASFAANWITATMGVQIGRITGLDPALPFFATLDPNSKLDASDAKFVDIVHTNSGIYGKIEATGHADFYVNGGTFQQACVNSKNPPICSHMLAPIYYAETITPASMHGFPAIKCAGYLQYMLGWCHRNRSRENIAYMGEYCNTRTRGIYFGETASAPPYATTTTTTTTTTN